jgi:hypothetical protein
MSMSMSVVLERGEIPESLDEEYGPAKSLAAHLDTLGAPPRRIGLEPLGGFVHDYVEEVEEIAADGDMDEADLEAAPGGMGAPGPGTTRATPSGPRRRCSGRSGGCRPGSGGGGKAPRSPWNPPSPRSNTRSGWGHDSTSASSIEGPGCRGRPRFSDGSRNDHPIGR